MYIENSIYKEFNNGRTYIGQASKRRYKQQFSIQFKGTNHETVIPDNAHNYTHRYFEDENNTNKI